MSIHRSMGLIGGITSLALLCTVGGVEGAPSTETFNTPGSHQWPVPAGITSVTVNAWGAQGGIGAINSGAAGLGGSVSATIAVTPGETLYVNVGGQGANGNGSCATAPGGFNGGGDSGQAGAGGGASDVRQGGSDLADRVVVAGGGGGAGRGGSSGVSGAGGAGGGLVGGAGGTGTSGCCDTQGNGGQGGTQTEGGAGGTGGPGQDGFPGALGIGGSYNGFCFLGAGGGGYYGGGSGEEPGLGNDGAGGGGGGSSFTAPGATSVTHLQGGHTGNGLVTITYTPPPTFEILGFYQPIDMTLANQMRAGRAVPVKFEVFEVGGAEVTDPAVVTSITATPAAGCTSLPADPVEEFVSTGSGLRYDTTGGFFIINWKTPSTRGCYKLTVTTTDNESISALFDLR